MSYPNSAPPHSGPQPRTHRTLPDSWVWLGATEGGLRGCPTLCSSEVGYRPLIGRASNELIMSSLFHPPLTWTKAFAS